MSCRIDVTKIETLQTELHHVPTPAYSKPQHNHHHQIHIN